MRNRLSLILTLCVILEIAGCGQSPQTPDTAATSSTATCQETIVDTEYYTLETPNSWVANCFYQVSERENGAYSLSFYDKASHEDLSGGWLFTIVLLTEWEEYTVYPNYEVLGSLDVYRIGSYNMMVTYPTDVQFSEKTAKTYNETYAEIPTVLAGISFKENVTFSKSPLPTDSIQQPSQEIAAQ